MMTPLRRLTILGLAAGTVLGMGVASLWLWPDGRNPEELEPAAGRTMLVLPLEDRTPEPSSGGVDSESLTRDVIDGLSNTRDLSVVPWMTCRQLAGASGSPLEVGRDLGVDLVLSGHVVRLGDVMQGEMRLLETASGTTLGVDPFAESPDSHEEIVRLIVGTTVARLDGDPAAGDAAPSRASSRDPEAFALYEKGIRALAGESEVGVALAETFFRKALELEPDLAEAHVGLGAAQSQKYYFGWGGLRVLDTAEEEYRRALALDPALEGAHAGLITLYWARGEMENCLRQGKLVSELGLPEIETLFLRARAYYFGEFPDRAVPLLEKVLDRQPDHRGAAWYLVTAAAWADSYEKAINVGLAFETQFGREPEVKLWIGYAYWRTGRLDEALRYMTEAMALYGNEPNTYVHRMLGLIHLDRGDEDAARRTWLRGLQIMSRRLERQPDNAVIRHQLLLLHAALGHREELRRGLDEFTRRGYPRDWIAHLYVCTGQSRRASELIRAGRWSFWAMTSREQLLGVPGCTLRQLPDYAELVELSREWDADLRARY